MSDNAKFTTKLRHVDIHKHWLRQEVRKGTINIRWTPTAEILADGLTKALSAQRHKEFVRLIGMEDIKGGKDLRKGHNKGGEKEGSANGRI